MAALKTGFRKNFSPKQGHFHRIQGKEGSATEQTKSTTESTLTPEVLESLDWSLAFLLILIAGVLLSFFATAIQRNWVARAVLCGAEEAAPDVFPLRWKTGILSAGAAGFFAFLARRTLCRALEQGDCAQVRSARAGALAAALAFAATLIRLDDLGFIAASRQSAALEETLTPE